MGKQRKAIKWYSFRWRTGLYVLMLVILFFGYIGWCYHLGVRELPMGAGPAGPLVPSGVFGKIWTQEKVVMVGLGDSITDGFGAPPEHNYFSLLQSNDDVQYPDIAGSDLGHVLPALDSYNYAENCSVSEEHLVQVAKMPVWPSDVKGIVVITSGGNDLIHSYGRSEPRDGAMYGCSYKQAQVWTENIKQRIREILDVVNAKFPGGCEIFLANIYDPTDGVSDPHIVGFPRWSDGVRVLNLTNQKIADLCRSYDNVHLVDIHSEFFGHGIHCTEFWRKHYRKNDPHYWYYYNLEDPNPRGYDAIRRLFLNEMIKVLPDRFSKCDDVQETFSIGAGNE